MLWSPQSMFTSRSRSQVFFLLFRHAFLKNDVFFRCLSIFGPYSKYFTLWVQDHTLAIAYRLPIAGSALFGPWTWARALASMAEHMVIKGNR